jgi:carbonic anhydrase
MTNKHLLLAVIIGLFVGFWWVGIPASIQASAPGVLSPLPHAPAGALADGTCADKPWTWDPTSKTHLPPARWKEGRGSSACGTGQQSPINLDGLGNDLGDVEFHYKQFTGKAENNGYKDVVPVLNGEGGGIKIGARTYVLTEFHFHTESEHTIKGTRSKIELHLVHKTLDQPEEFAAVGVLFDEANQGGNTLVRNLIDSTPLCGRGGGQPIEINPDKLFPGDSPKGKIYYSYSGSLTNPDCDRIANFMVAQQIGRVPMGLADTLSTIVSTFPNNKATPQNYKFNYRRPQTLLDAVGHRKGS